MAEGGDFSSLIGSQALIAKQLDLWWRYELLPESSMHIDGDIGDDDMSNFPPQTPEERLTRKTYLTVPFLMRNISNCPFQPRKSRKEPRSRPSVIKRRDSSEVDVIAQCFGIGSPNRAKRKRNHEGDSVAVGFVDSIKQRISGWFSSPEKSPPQSPALEDKRTSGQKGPSPIISKRLQVDTLQSRPLRAYELYIQSSQVCEMILDGIDSSLHHDEDLVKNRIEASWQEMTSDESVSKTNELLKEGSSMGIDKYAYWLDMEKKEKMKLDDEGYSHTHNKKRKINNHLESILASNSLPSNWCTGTFSPVFFHYTYVNQKNHPSTVVEKRLDRKCPFCSYQGKSDEDLLGHCGIWHGVLTDYYQWRGLECGLSFQAVLDEESHLHIVVKSLSCGFDNELDSIDEFTFVQTECIQMLCSRNSLIPFLLRSHKNVAAMDPTARNRRLLALQSNDAPADVISRYLPTDEAPIRQYFHSRTNLPLEDWNNIDSDDEPDEEWLHKMSSDLIGEFEDITYLEKNFMQMWNRFIKCHVVIADREIPAKCQEFIHNHIQDLKDGKVATSWCLSFTSSANVAHFVHPLQCCVIIYNIKGGMRNNLLLHLMNLWDSGVISSNRILSCMQQYDKGVADLSDANDGNTY